MLPNLVTLLRLAILPALYLLVANGGDPARAWALALFLLAGASDILDGQLARRLGLASPFGAFLDLTADRLLTLTVTVALIASGGLPGVWAAAGLVLVIRDFTVAGLNESLPGAPGPGRGHTEAVKVALQFLGFGLLVAPQAMEAQALAGRIVLMMAAALAAATTAVYVRRAVR